MTISQIRESKAVFYSLSELAVAFLERYYEPYERSFPFTVRLHDAELTPYGQSVRYTLISLIGLSNYKKRGNKTNIPLEDTLRTLIQQCDLIRSVGDIGLLLWASSLLLNKHDFDNLYDKVVSSNVGDIYQFRKLGCLDLEFLLIGLCHASTRLRGSSRAQQLAKLVYKFLLQHFNPRTGLFCFNRYSLDSPLKRFYNRNIGFFAEQIYGIYSLTEYFELSACHNALQMALFCAETVCRLQTNQGEWLWQYNTRSGTIVEKYPVYSVHQDGMAPMALLKLMRFVDMNYMTNIMNGINWLITERKESGPIVDWENGLIWRSIKKIPIFRKICSLKKAAIVVNLNMPSKQHAKTPGRLLEIDYETRPYHYAWILQAQNELIELSNSNCGNIGF